MTTLKEIKKVITISDGNRKLGIIPSLSLPPVRTCREDAPCIKDCYAMKAWRLYPSVRDAYSKNLYSYYTNPELYRKMLWAWLKKKSPTYFRYNVSGDIPDIGYRNMIVDTAQQFPNIKFLVFTKKYGFFVGSQSIGLVIPDNLSIIFSAWPGLELPTENMYSIAFMQDGTEKRTDGTEIECPGNCESCGMCWQLPKIGKNVVFKKH